MQQVKLPRFKYAVWIVVFRFVNLSNLSIGIYQSLQSISGEFILISGKLTHMIK